MLSISRAVEVNPLGPVQAHDPPLVGCGPRFTAVLVEDTVAVDSCVQVPLTDIYGTIAVEVQLLALTVSAMFVLAVVIAPIAEEYFFRGLLYRALDREWGGWAALGLSAAYFAIYHPPVSWLPVAGLGLLNAFLFKRTGNLVIVSAIDNLIGGTAGMAVQCMNIMFVIPETTGLKLAGMMP